jgi:hypothetical protein
VDLYEEGENLVVKVLMPGVKQDDIEVTLDQGMLTIRGRTKQEAERKDRSYIVREHRTGSIVRQVQVPQTVDADAVQATFQQGVLQVILPKGQPPTAYRVPIATPEKKAIESATGAETSAPGAETPAAASSPSDPPVADVKASGSRKRTGSRAAQNADNEKSARRKTSKQKAATPA